VTVPQRISWAVDHLDVQPTDRLVEIGCGRGVAVELICQRLAEGHVLALDRSATAVEAAAQRNARYAAAGSASFEAISLEDAELGEAQFDKVFGINVNLFWTRAASHELAAVKRALVPSGRLYLFYEPPSASRAVDIAERVVPRLDAAGFATQVVTGSTSKGASLLALISHVVT
jgi:cyclopropane fatty-acyl-phospholipid synthase-like methyltransferase